MAGMYDCKDWAYGCTPGYTGANASGTWAWSYYGGSWAQTPNGYHNCTLYAAFRLAQSGMPSPGRSWGNAIEWAGALGGGDNTPAVGSIAWWGTSIGTYGHVAYVEQVSGGNVFIRADAWSPTAGFTSAGWVAASSVPKFLHPHDVASWPPADGSLVHLTDNGEIYKMIGGAPVYQASLAGVDYTSTQDIRRAQLDSLPTQPADGAFVNGVPSGRVFRIAGGAPEYVGAWSSFGGPQPTTSTYDMAIDQAGSGGLWNHLNRYPRDGTFVSNTADGRVYRIAGGAPLYVASWADLGGAQATTSLDPFEFANYQHLRATPSDMFLRGLPSNRIFRVVNGGHPYYVGSWDPYGGSQPFLDVDDWAIDNCDHLRCEPFGSLDAAVGYAGGIRVTGWATDPNSQSPVTVHVYADGKDVAQVSAGQSRPDVDNAFHRGANYGYDAQVPLAAGSQRVCVSAINLGQGEPATDLGCATATAQAAPTTAPGTPTPGTPTPGTPTPGTPTPGTPTVVVTASLVSATVPAHAPAHLRGSVDRYRGATVSLRQLVGSSWTTVTSRTIPTGAADGRYSFALRTSSTGARTYAVTAISPGASRGTSPARTLTVVSAAIAKVHPGGAEYVVVRNTGRVPLSLLGWRLRRRGGPVVTLPAHTVRPGAVVRILTGPGRGSAGRVNLGSAADLWHASGVALLTTGDGARVARLRY